MTHDLVECRMQSFAPNSNFLLKKRGRSTFKGFWHLTVAFYFLQRFSKQESTRTKHYTLVTRCTKGPLLTWIHHRCCFLFTVCLDRKLFSESKRERPRAGFCNTSERFDCRAYNGGSTKQRLFSTLLPFAPRDVWVISQNSMGLQCL